MLKIILFLSYLTLVFGSNKNRSNIINGQDAMQGQFPYQVHLHLYFCPTKSKVNSNETIFLSPRYLGLSKKLIKIYAAAPFIQKMSS